MEISYIAKSQLDTYTLANILPLQACRPPFAPMSFHCSLGLVEHA